jgi:transposase
MAERLAMHVSPDTLLRLEAWLARARATGLPALARFAEGIERDRAVVVGALSTEISKGQVEGHVCLVRGYALVLQRRINSEV